MPAITPVRIKMTIYSVWRQTGRVASAIDWPKLCATGRFIEGVKGTICPNCKGHGDVPGYLYNQVECKVVCQDCHGSGRVQLNKKNSKINPAFIAATKRGIDDGEMLEIDRVMCELRRNSETLSLYLVLLYEYTRNGTQEMKAARVDVTIAYYKKQLMMAHKHMDTALNKYMNSKTKSVLLA